MAEEKEKKDASENAEEDEKEEAKEAAEKEPKQAKPAEKSGPKKIIRMGEKDIDGSLTVHRALREISGVSFVFANAISKLCGFSKKKVGDLSDEEKKKIEDMISNPAKHGVPRWMYNRRFDPENGEDMHFVSSKLELRRKMDINELKKRKCYRGIRHIQGLPVRGQRTRSSFRKSASVGVSRSKARNK